MADCLLSPEVKLFLQHSATPPKAFLNYADKLHLRIILPLVSKQIDSSSFEDICQWTNAFLSALDTPENLQGILLAEPVFQYRLRLLLQKMPSQAAPACDILDKLFQELRDYAKKRLDQGVFARRPRLESAPLFAFHLAAFNPLGRPEPPCALYAQWGELLHTGLRQIQTTTQEFETFRWYATSARLFFVHFPHSQISVVPSLPLTSDMFKQHLQHFSNGYTAGRHMQRRKRTLPEIAKGHCQRLWRLFHQHRVHPNPHKGGTPSPDDSDTTLGVIDDAPATSAPPPNVTDATPSIRTAIVTDRLECEDTSPDPAQTDSDETVSEWIFPTEEQPLVRRPPHLPYHSVSRYILHQYDFWWDSKCLGLHAIVPLYQAVEQWRCLSIPQYGALCLILLLPLYSGRSAREYEASVIARYPLHEETETKLAAASGLSLDLAKEWFFFHQNALRSSFQQPQATGWLASTAWVPFPIPEPLLALWRPYVRWLDNAGLSTPGSPVLQYADTSGHVKPLTLEDIPALIKASGIDASRIPNVSDLCRGFRGWIVHGFGLDDVSSNFTSGRLARVGPKPRYTHLSIAHFHSEYQHCCKGLHDLVSSYVSSPGWWSDRLDAADGTGRDGSVYGVGSPVVLGEPVLREQIQKVAHAIKQAASLQRPEDIVAHHNAYTTYAALALGILGIRPRNDLGLLYTDCLGDVDCIPIVDKLSSLYIEDRLIGCPPTAEHIIQTLATGRARLIRILEIYFGRPTAESLTSTRLLVILQDDGRATAFSLPKERELLLAFGSDHLGRAPLNVGRHVNRTSKVSTHGEDIIDFHIGHQRAGREPFCSFGSAFIGRALKLLTTHHEELVTRLGFEKLRYLPGCQ